MKKIALVGCGRIMERHIEAIAANPGLAIVQVCDKNEAKAAGAKWDKTEKTWCAPKGTDLAALARWTGARA